MNTILLLCALAIIPQEPSQDMTATIPKSIAKWETDIAKFETLTQTEPIVDDAILYYGSSSIRRWNSLTEDMAPWPAIQRGYGGAKLPDIIHYAPRVLKPFLGETNPKRCKAIVLFVANDIVGKESDATPEEVTELFTKLHKWIRSHDGTLPIFWIEVTPTPSRWKAWPKILASTKQIEAIVDTDKNSHIVLTAGAYLGLDGRPRADLFVDDRLHLSGSGYHQWSLLIKSQLYANLAAPTPIEKESQKK
jgi:hypothetical protein